MASRAVRLAMVQLMQLAAAARAEQVAAPLAQVVGRAYLKHDAGVLPCTSVTQSSNGRDTARLCGEAMRNECAALARTTRSRPASLAV
jgi:hypothetical protein